MVTFKQYKDFITMNSTINNLAIKLDSSLVMSKYQKKNVVLKRKGPHIGLYVKDNNKHIWVCWTNKSEQILLKDLGVKIK